MSTRYPAWPLSNGPFIGRKRLLAELRDALFDSETPRHISIYGMPRVGKSWLLSEAVKDPPDNIILISCELSRSFYYIMRNFFLAPRRRWRGKLSSEELQSLQRTAESFGAEADTSELLAVFRKLLQTAKEMGYRVVLLLDEFDRIMEPGWTEEEYNGFVGLLMDRELNVACAAASRRTVESLISHNQYRWQLNPFESWLLTGFDEEDMEECLQRLEDEGCPIASEQELDKLMYWCGRNPHLLIRTVLTPYVEKRGAVTLEAIYAREEKQDAFISHFNDVLSFMWQEEKLREHSFSHIVKCYFDPSPDYRDIQERFIGMGYLELLNPKSKYTWSGCRERFVYKDTFLRYKGAKFVDKLPRGEREYAYITLSPYFIDRFYTADFPAEPGESGRKTVLDQVKDAKDLLAGFVHTLRDITSEELRKASCADCRYKARCPRCGRGEMAGVFGAQWNEKLLRNCVKARGRGGDVLFSNRSSPRGFFEAQDLRAEKRCIQISSPSDFLLSAFNRSGAERSRTPLLDPINLSSNGQLIMTFQRRFQNYFGCFQSFRSDPYKEFMPALKNLEKARNEIAHYSRVGMTSVMADDTAALCRYLLRSIYLWRREGKVSPPSHPPRWNS